MSTQNEILTRAQARVVILAEALLDVLHGVTSTGEWTFNEKLAGLEIAESLLRIEWRAQQDKRYDAREKQLEREREKQSEVKVRS